MIDNSAQVDRLLSKLEAALPLAAHIPPDLAEVLRDDVEAGHVPATCEVTEISYAGDEGAPMTAGWMAGSSPAMTTCGARN
jgi:hypothetical protein